MKHWISLISKSWVVLSLTLTSCVVQNTCPEPTICYYPQERYVERLPETFPPLSCDEYSTDWGKELIIGQSFGKDLDLYRSITALKRAKILCPPNEQRQQQIDYSLVFAYWLGNKYCEAIDIFENSTISCIGPDFPGFMSLLTILYECYDKTGDCEKASHILDIINTYDPTQTAKLQTSSAFQIGSFQALQCIEKDPCTQEVVDDFFFFYDSQKKDPGAAQILNAVLPGSGYLYVGQTKTALTSFLLNALFIAATWQFFEHGYTAAGIFTLSLETGWYIGGINGAGLAAKQYNECLYNAVGKESMLKGGLFPILMIQTGF